MDQPRLARMLEDALDRLGVQVRVERMPDEARLSGGLCFVRGKAEVFVSPRVTEAERIHVLVGALRELDNESIWLPPAVRKLIQKEPRSGSSETAEGGSETGETQ